MYLTHITVLYNIKFISSKSVQNFSRYYGKKKVTELLHVTVSEISTHYMSKSHVPTECTHEGNLDFASVMIISSKAL